MKRALVTGATGMLGTYIVECLRAAGWTVRALVRDGSPAEGVAALGAEVVRGDVRDAASVAAAARGCAAVFHAAATIGAGSDWEAFRLGNVVGTANVVAAVEAAGSRLVQVSSTSVFGRDRYRRTPIDESHPLPVLPARDAYGRSKQEAERLVLAAHAAGRIRATVVRPPMMYGKRDRQFVPRVGPVLERGLFPLVADGTAILCLIHARSVAEGALRAATSEAAGGQVYHLANDHALAVADLVKYAALGLGREVRTLRLSRGAARLAFGGLALVLALAGRRHLAPHAAGVRDLLTRDNPFTSERARRELQWTPTVRPADGVPEAFRWWRDHHRTPDGPVPPSVLPRVE